MKKLTDNDQSVHRDLFDLFEDDEQERINRFTYALVSKLVEKGLLKREDVNAILSEVSF